VGAVDNLDGAGPTQRDQAGVEAPNEVVVEEPNVAGMEVPPTVIRRTAHVNNMEGAGMQESVQEVRHGAPQWVRVDYPNLPDPRHDHECRRYVREMVPDFNYWLLMSDRGRYDTYRDLRRYLPPTFFRRTNRLPITLDDDLLPGQENSWLQHLGISSAMARADI